MNKTIPIIIFSLLTMGILLFVTGLYYYVPDIPVEELNKKYGVRADHYIQMQGMNVHYRIEGLEKDTVPLVLLHGTGSSLYTWNGWISLLQENKKIIRLDLPGFGLTGPHPENDYTIENYLEFMHSFLSRLGVQQCILVGNSLGGEIAWRYALNYPHQVEKLVLLSPAGYPTEVDYVPMSYVLLRIPVLRDLVNKITPPQTIRNSLEYLYGNPEKVTDELVELYFDMTCREGNREALVERMEVIAEPAPYEQVPTIQIPALLLWGERDELIPIENAEYFHRDLPNSTLLIFPEAGHMPMEEIPEKTANAVDHFLRSSL